MSHLSGVITAIPTPLLDNEDIDLNGLRKVIDYDIEMGVSGIFLFGGMGEGPALLASQKKEAVKVAVKHINGRVPLLVSIADVSTRKAFELGKMMQQLGPDYLVATAPFYYSFSHPDSIMKHVISLCDGLKKPIVFYNIPGDTGNSVSIDTMDTIINLPKIVAIKDSSRDAFLIMELLRRYPDKETRPCSFFQGDEFMYDMALLMGADGVITGGGTLFVDTLTALYEAALKGDRLETFKLQKKFRKQMDEVFGPEMRIDWMHGVKAELKRRGICGDNVTSPFLKRR
ncbi:MAG: dihydrodipicolinate synthase family protein [Planctomycetota bacterium]|jgi:4-hydroxy-tetrahydrodipicolinate synthase